MSNEAQTPEHGDFPDLVQRYATDQAKKGDARSPEPAPPPSPLPPIPQPPKPAEEPPAAPPALVPFEPIPGAPVQSYSVDDLKELERFRLGIWLTKIIVSCTMLIMFGLLLIYTWIAATTKTLPDMGVLGTIFGHLKEVIVIIIDAQKS